MKEIEQNKQIQELNEEEAFRVSAGAKYTVKEFALANITIQRRKTRDVYLVQNGGTTSIISEAEAEKLVKAYLERYS